MRRSSFNFREDPMHLRVVLVTAVALLSVPVAAEAAYTSSIAGSIVTMTGDANGDALVITNSGGLLMHNRYGDAGFNSAFDFDPGVAGDQVLAADGSIAFH